MKKILLLLAVLFSALLVQTNVNAQNIFSGEPVQVVGLMNGYSSAAAANSVYRLVSVPTGTPTDGRGQWMKTYNAQSSGGDVLNSNMSGGGGNGFLFISGPSSNRFQNKWVFSGVGQGALNAINGISAFNSGNDMGLNMGTAGRYTFVFNDCGYTQTNAKFYVGYTSNAPVSVTNGGVTFSGGQPVVSITTSAAPSSGENIYVRYRATTNDFTAGTAVVQASGSGTSWTATLPQQTCGNTVYFYVYSSTRTLSQINADSEGDRALAILRYDDNSGNNYSFTVTPSTAAVISGNALICAGATTNLQVAITGGVSPYSVVYNINGGSPATVNNYTSGSNIAVSPSVNTTYTIVSVTGANGCAGTGNSGSPLVNIKVNVGLSSATASATPICSSSTTTLTYSGLTGTNASVTWYDGAGGTGGTHGTGTPSSAVGPGTYHAYATGDCGSPVDIQVIVDSKTNVSITSATASPAGPLCSGATTTLSANGVAGTNALVTWYTGSGATGINLGTGTSLPGQGAGTYYAYVTGDCGPAQEQSVTVGSIGNTFSGTGNWTDNARWSCGAPPSSGDAVTIAAGANATLNTNFIVSGSLIMNATSTLIVNPTRTLSVDVASTANFNGQSVTFKSDATGTASLGQVNGTLSGATNVTVERYIPNNGFRSWRLLSVPTYGSGQTIRQAWQEGNANPLPQQNNLPGYGTQISGKYNIQSIAAAAGFDSISVSAGMLTWGGASWVDVTNTNVALAGNKSYFLYIRGERSKSVTGAISNSSSTTLRTNGTVYTGDQVNSIGASAFYLVPNLYPSAINFTGLTRTGGVSNLFYTWDSKKQSGNSLGVYQTFSGTNSFNTLISGGSYTLGQPNTTIESGQSFFVQSSTAGSLTLKESAKISGTSGSLGFRPSANPGRIDSRLYSGTEMLDANVVVFDAAYDRAVDADDAVKLGNPGANFAVETDSKILAIEGTQAPVNNDAIQFRLWNLQQQDYRLEFAVSNLNTQGLSAQLEDKYLNTTTPIDLNSSTTVNFTVDANTGSSDANRFRLVFKQSAPLPITFISIAANRTTGGIKVDWKVAAERNIRNYEVERSTDGRNFTAIGTVTATGNAGADLSYNFTDAGAPQTVLFYRVKSAGTAGDSKYSTIVKAGSGSTKAGYAVSPNPVENGVVNLQFINQAAGKYTVRIMGTAGQRVMLATISHAGGNSTQLLELPATMARGAYQVEIIAPDKTRTVQMLLVN